jgi:hypothetical protein
LTCTDDRGGTRGADHEASPLRSDATGRQRSNEGSCPIGMTSAIAPAAMSPTKPTTAAKGDVPRVSKSWLSHRAETSLCRRSAADIDFAAAAPYRRSIVLRSGRSFYRSGRTRDWKRFSPAVSKEWSHAEWSNWCLGSRPRRNLPLKKGMLAVGGPPGTPQALDAAAR